MKQTLQRRFRRLLVLQVALLALTLSIAIAAWLRSSLMAVPLLLSGLCLIQVLALLRSVQAHIDSLEEFFSTVAYEDFTRRFIEGEGDGELSEAFNRILARFQEARAERDLQAGYLDTVVRHVPVPILAARSDGSLTLVNNPAKRLTGMPGLRSLDELAEQDPQLPAALRQIPAGRQRLLQSRMRGVPVELRVAVSEIRRDGQAERLYSFENLSGELSARESSAWRNLIRVLTHEIMNTLTPVTSLAQTTATLIDDPEARDDVREAVQTIGRRSEGLMHFVASYRELMQLPEPEIGAVNVADLFDDLLRLQSDALAGVVVEVGVEPPSLSIDADRKLIEQLLINLLKNAVEALAGTDEPKIRLSAVLDFGRVLLTVEDNGPGIPEDIRDEVFIPFFTTKRDGSGIGLSLCRQIMNAHGGELVLEAADTGTSIKLVFA